MKRKWQILGLFSCLALVQLAVPVSMIAIREITLHSGRQFKFRTAPLDPYDAFRGRYVALTFDEEEVPIPEEVELRPNQKVCAHIEEDDKGFARIRKVSVGRPKGGDSIRARVRWVGGKGVRVSLPFDRYYMGEKVAPAAEEAYLAHTRRGSQDAYVTVRVRSGFAMLEQLYVGGKPIEEFLREGQ